MGVPNHQGPPSGPFSLASMPQLDDDCGMTARRQTPTRPSDLLPSLDAHPETIKGSEAAKVQRTRQEIGRRLAAVLAKGPVEILDGEIGPSLVCTESGEILDDEAAAFAAMLHLTAGDDNHFAGRMDQDGGGAFFGGSALHKFSLRIDPNWGESYRRRSRARGREAYRKMRESLPPEEKLAIEKGWAHRLTSKLLTLTMPRAHGKSELQEMERFQRAFSLLRKRDYWKAKVWGGVKGVEDALDADGSHVHGHLLILSRYLDRERMREDWRECLDRATWEGYGYGLAEDCPVIMDIRIIKKKSTAERPGLIDFDDAINEVSKYVTKPSDFLEPDEHGRTVPRETLLGICRVPRWPRMFELLGECRGRIRKATTKATERAQAALAALASIHRAYLTGEPLPIPPCLRQELADRGAYDTDDDADCIKRLIRGLRDMVDRPPPRPKVATWRELLGVIPFQDWLQTIMERAERGRKFRMKWLLEHNPNGIFCLFDGRTLTNPDMM